MVKSLFTLCNVRTMILPPLQSVNNDFTTTTKFEQWFYQHFTKCEQWYYQHFVKCEQWFYQQLEFYLLFLQLLQFSTMWILWDGKYEYWFSTSLMLQNSWITCLRLLILSFLKHWWCGKPTTHIYSSEYSLIVTCSNDMREISFGSFKSFVDQNYKS